MWGVGRGRGWFERWGSSIYNVGGGAGIDSLGIFGVGFFLRCAFCTQDTLKKNIFSKSEREEKKCV